MKWWLTCIRKYVTFEGRARRKEYWMFTLFNVVFVVVTMLLDILLFGATPDNPTSPFSAYFLDINTTHSTCLDTLELITYADFFPRTLVFGKKSAAFCVCGKKS